MTLRRIASFALALAGVLAAPLAAAPAKPNWAATVVLTPDNSHIEGNPKAALKLTEYVSYTCPHCSHFETEAGDILRGTYVSGGKVQVEVRHFLRDPIDATVAQLTNCGPKEKFFGNHHAFMVGQAQWIEPMANITDAQRTRWTTGDYPTRRRAIATDFHFYEMMERRGYTRTQLDACLADEGLAKRLVAQTVAADKFGVQGTPSFALNGALLQGTHSWDLLEPQLKARM